MRPERILAGAAVAFVLAAVTVALGHGSDRPEVEDWWPGPATRDLPREVIDIPSLDDAAFMAEVRQLLQDIGTTPTNPDNIDQRVDLARRYYNALQADGVLLPWMTLIMMNAMQGFASATPAEYRQWVGMFDQFVPGLYFIQQHRHDIGSLEVVEPREKRFKARELTSIRLVYHVGKLPLKRGAQIRFGQHWYSDLSLLQLTRPLSPGYTTVKASTPGVELTSGFGPWQSVWSVLQTPSPRPLVTVKTGELHEGDTLTFVLGDRSGGGPGLLMQSYATDDLSFRFEIDFDGSGLFVPVGLPRFWVEGAEPHHIRVIAPSTVAAGESFTVRASVEDQYFNRAAGGPDELTLWLDGEQVATTHADADDPAVFRFANLRYPAGGGDFVWYEARDGDGRLRGRSNPLHLIGPGEPHVYWGELHGHEGYTDATGSAEWYMHYARDVGFLDFASLTGHDLMMSEFYQRDVERATRKYNQAGRFVTFKAYEWTQQARDGGHHNVFYRDDEERIIPVNEAPTITDLYRLQRQTNDPDKVLIIPHCHEPGDWNFSDALLERLVEVYSQHGSFEWFGRRYLERGYHLGLIAASDDHTGHPGNSPARISNRGGVTAVFAPELTRGAVFDGLKARRAYGTTLARMYLEANVDGAPMGSDLDRARPNPPQIEVRGRVAGTAPIARVVAVLNGEDAALRDYLQPPAGESGQGTAALRVMITNSSEPQTKTVTPPLGRERWWGRISLASSEIEAMTPLGLDGYGDTFRQVSGKRVDFTCTVRGDQDGALLELDRFDPKDVLTVEIYTRPYVELESWHFDEPMPLWGEEHYENTKLVQRITIPLSELAAGVARRPFGDRSAVIAERVGGALSPLEEFSFTLRDGVKPEGENYVYIRAEQIDDQVAWSSPVWVMWQ